MSDPRGRFVAPDEKGPLPEAVRDLIEWLEDRHADPIFQINLLLSTLVTQTARHGLPAQDVATYLALMAKNLPEWTYGLRVLNTDSDDDDQR